MLLLLQEEEKNKKRKTESSAAKKDEPKVRDRLVLLSLKKGSLILDENGCLGKNEIISKKGKEVTKNTLLLGRTLNFSNINTGIYIISPPPHF